MIQSTATQERAGASTHHWRTPEVVLKDCDSQPPTRTRDVVPWCRSAISWMRKGGAPVDRSAFHSATLSAELNAALISMYATCRGWLNSWCSSDRRRSARMASIVERPAVNPDCWVRRRAVSSGWSLANRTLAKTLPETDSSEMGRWLPQSVRWPFSLYNETIIPSRHSAGTFPVFHTCMKRAYKAAPTGSSAYLSSSG